MHIIIHHKYNNINNKSLKPISQFQNAVSVIPKNDVIPRGRVDDLWKTEYSEFFTKFLLERK